jgi:hypothetical protein
LTCELVQLCDGETDGDLVVGEVGHEGDESEIVFDDRHGYLFVFSDLLIPREIKGSGCCWCGNMMAGVRIVGGCELEDGSSREERYRSGRRTLRHV